jgi:hypothetical protein
MISFHGVSYSSAVCCMYGVLHDVWIYLLVGVYRTGYEKDKKNGHTLTP